MSKSEIYYLMLKDDKREKNRISPFSDNLSQSYTFLNIKNKKSTVPYKELYEI